MVGEGGVAVAAYERVQGLPAGTATLDQVAATSAETTAKVVAGPAAEPAAAEPAAAWPTAAEGPKPVSCCVGGRANMPPWPADPTNVRLSDFFNCCLCDPLRAACAADVVCACVRARRGAGPSSH